MYRRLEIIQPEVRYYYQGQWHKEPAVKLGIIVAADASWLDKIRGPKKRIPGNTRFFFTEKGWRRVGRHVVAAAKRAGQDVRVIAVKENSVSVVWADDFEVAAQPKRPRSKKKRWYY